MTTNTDPADQITWEDIEPLLNQEENQEFLQKINPKTYKLVLDKNSREQVVEAILELLKERDPENANREYAEKVVEMMQEVAKGRIQDISWIWHSPKLTQLAQINFKRYIAILYKLIVEDEKQYDVLMAGGNSGLIMARWAQMFYSTAGIDAPVVLKTTPQRYFPYEEEAPENLVDNTVLYLDIYNQMKDSKIQEVSSILFVDDEIGAGITAKACVNAVIKALSTPGNIDLDIVAEDQDYKSKDCPSNVQVNFTPFAKEIEGINNTVMYLIPNEIYKDIKSFDASDKSKVALLLGLPRRTKTTFLDGFDYSLNHQAFETIPSFLQLMERFELFIYDLINEAIDEYKVGKINLNDFSYVEKFIQP